MCGIAGIWNFPSGAEESRRIGEKMIARLGHRGPEDQEAISGDGWSLAHARLAIIDLAGGHQPIWDEDHQVVLVGNTEIYNAPELRSELEALGHRFRTHSDTEVPLHAWKQWGEEAFARLSGMFVVAIVDLRQGLCVLARDAMGIKPLHLARVGAGYAFGSEIKALLDVPGFETAPDWDAAHLFMNLRYIPDERTLFRGVQRLEPGSIAILNREGEMRTKRYFSLWDIEPSGPITDAQAVDQLQGILDRSVSRHLISDVELVSYLSGGVDSSVVTTLAARQKPGLRSFCVAFGEPTDENEDARKVARLAGTKHADLSVASNPLERLSQVIWHVEEPKVNAVQGFLLAEAVSREVKVALSGLGGDELFAGYVNNDILYPMTVASRLARLKTPFSLSRLQKFFSGPQSDLMFRGAELGLNMFNPVQFYAILRNSFDHNPHLMRSLYGNYPKHWEGMTARVLGQFYNPENRDMLNEILRLEARTKLINDFLLTEDRVSMAHSLEVRVPLLDQELVKFAFSLPSSMKYRPRDKKRLLKQAALPLLGSEILNKKKWGFSFNPVLLFEKQLKPLAQEVLTEKKVREMGLFSWSWIQRVLNTPPSPRMRWHYFNLWVMIGFASWHEQFFGHGKRS